MPKRTRRPPPAEPAKAEPTGAAWAAERHSGEGSASALETLQKLESGRVATRPVEPGPEADPIGKGTSA